MKYIFLIEICSDFSGVFRRLKPQHLGVFMFLKRYKALKVGVSSIESWGLSIYSKNYTA